APKGRRRTYDVSRDTLTGCSSRGNVGLPRGELRVLCCRLRPVERAHFPSHAPSMLVSGSDWRNGVRNRHLRCKIPSRTCLHWVKGALLPAAPCPLLPVADIGPREQSVGQATQLCLVKGRAAA